MSTVPGGVSDVLVMSGLGVGFPCTLLPLSGKSGSVFSGVSQPISRNRLDREQMIVERRSINQMIPRTLGISALSARFAKEVLQFATASILDRFLELVDRRLIYKLH